MENRFLEMDDCLRRISGKKGRYDNARSPNGSGSYANGVKGIASSLSFEWANALSTQDRVLVILIENGGVDLGIPTLVDKLLASVPGASLIPDSYRQKLVDQIKETIKSFTDSLLESVELSVNRYAAAKPNLFGDVVVLRDGTSSYQDLTKTLISLSNDKKITDLFILTHGSDNSISVPGGINGQKIRDMRVENGKPLSIRSVYMMNCVGSSLNQAWIDAGAKVASGALRNNYLPEPTMFFFWQNWQEGQTFENAVTSAYRKTINLMNEAVRGFLGKLGISGAASVNFENFDFVRDSAPVIQGQRSVTINSDDLTFSQSVSSSLATTVLPVSLLRSLSVSQSDADLQKVSRSVSQQGIDFIKGWEGFRATMYNDPVGHCTIGYGTLLHHGNCDGRSSEQPYINGVSEENATQLLAREVAGIQQTINNTVTVALNQNSNDALVSFVYNIGSSNFQKSTLLKFLNQGNYSAVPTEIRKWTKARQNGQLVDLPGLVRRRKAEAELFQKPSQGQLDAAIEKSMDTNYDTDMQTIRDYVLSVVEAKSKIATTYLSAIDNFQTTVQSASLAETKPDILGVILKSGLKTVEKLTITAVKSNTGADLGPLVDMMHAIYDEIDRAAKAAQSLAVAEWIKNTRTSIANAYTQDQTGEGLRNKLEGEYKQNDEGGRGGYIAGIQNELKAMGSIKSPKGEVVEVALYVAWINQSFNNDCMSGTGIIWIQLNDDGTPRSAAVNAPLGDKIAGALNNRMGSAGVNRLMDLDVVKKVCRGDVCMCFEGNNVVRQATSNDAVQAFLTSQDTWNKFRLFTS